jgi:lipopolysaccharide/colanic/teichoic acid biosynthesis glycosyltransferase
MNTDTGSPTATVLGLPQTLRRRVRTSLHATSAVTRNVDDAIVRPETGGVATTERRGAAELLSRDHFLKQLSREKRRADRSKAPLSLVLCQISEEASSHRDAERLIEVVQKNARDTDFIGWLGDCQVAALLPDTSYQGTQRFIEKINAKAGAGSFTPIAATYPDHLFDDVASGDAEALSTQPLFLDEDAAPLRRPTYPLKRALDIVGAIVGLVLLSPLMLAVAIAVAFSSPGPIIFRQSRVGRRGVPFVFYKFRSMRTDSDDRIHREFVENLIKGEHEKVNQQDAANPYYKMKADPRITAVGAFIRRTSIDEIPQFFNVLKGDMSLVGPRPPVAYEAKAYQSWHLRRVLEAKPGITGPWQVHGRSRVSFDEMVRMDLQYVQQASFRLDIMLLLKTVKVVLLRHGAG